MLISLPVVQGPLVECWSFKPEVQRPVAITVGVVLGPVLNLSESFQMNCVKEW